MTAVIDGFGLTRIGQIALTVKDLPAAVAFYRDALGLRLLFEAPPSMAFFDCGGVRLMLTPPEREGAVAGQQFNSILYFSVDAIGDARRREAEEVLAVQLLGDPRRRFGDLRRGLHHFGPAAALVGDLAQRRRVDSRVDRRSIGRVDGDGVDEGIAAQERRLHLA